MLTPTAENTGVHEDGEDTVVIVTEGEHADYIRVGPDGRVRTVTLFRGATTRKLSDPPQWLPGTHASVLAALGTNL